MSVYRFCSEWADGIADPDKAETRSRQWRSVNVFYRGRAIYSYGEHFIMGYMLSPGVVWLNGDVYSPTTSQHQSTLRRAVHAAGARAVIVPQSAIDGAGIDFTTIKPVHIESERFENEPHVSDTAPAGLRTDIPSYPWVRTGTDSSITFENGRAVYADTGEPATNYVGWIDTQRRQQAVFLIAGRYRWHTLRHWLGDSVFTAQRYYGSFGPGHEPESYWISSFDQQESRPLYFLSQLPGPANTVVEAIESLAPESVKTARDMGRKVVRQGDIFAIETEITTRALRAAGARFTKRSVSIEWSLRAEDGMKTRAALEQVKATMPPYPQRMYGGDVSHGAAVAYSEWIRERAEEWETELVARYHAMFPDHPELNVWQWRSALRFSPSVHDRMRDVTGEPLLSTAHTASTVATLPNGLQYARGCMYHEPDVINQNRERDHARRSLPGNRWYLVTRNTVPVRPSRRPLGLPA